MKRNSRRHLRARSLLMLTTLAIIVSGAFLWMGLRPQPVFAALQDPPAPIVVIYHAVPNLIEWTAGPGEHVATTQQAFDALLTQYKDDPSFVGTIIITDNPNPPGAWPPVCQGKVHLRFRFRDVNYYNSTWEPMLDQGWVPGFLQQQEVTPAPSIEETLYDYDVWTRVSSRYANVAVARVRKSDGGIGVVSAQTVLALCTAPPIGMSAIGDPCDDAGPWHPTCCETQRLICRSGAWIIGCLFNFQRCINCMTSGMLGDECQSCYQDCIDCAVNNPCHSCDPCGLSWLLCNWFGNC